MRDLLGCSLMAKPVEFGDWCIYKLELSDTSRKCLICSKLTNQKITAVHVVFKKMEMGACCSDECFKSYRKKYDV